MIFEKNNPIFVRRILFLAFCYQVGATAVCLLFTSRPLYCIITFLAAAFGILSFVILIRLVDRILDSGSGKGLYFLLTLAKMIGIAGMFFLVSRISEGAVLFFILGLSAVVFAILAEAVHRLLKG